MLTTKLLILALAVWLVLRTKGQLNRLALTLSMAGALSLWKAGELSGGYSGPTAFAQSGYNFCLVMKGTKCSDICPSDDCTNECKSFEKRLAGKGADWIPWANDFGYGTVPKKDWKKQDGNPVGLCKLGLKSFADGQ